jgi:hypothetical protein
MADGISQRLERVQSRMIAAACRAGRRPEEVALIAVTKTVGLPEIQELYRCGQRSFGENRPQAFRDRTKALPEGDIQWHFIGNLQTNKIKYVFPTARLVHSIDRLELIEAFGDWFRKTGRKCPCLLEVHISGEESKSGFNPGEILEVIRAVSRRDDFQAIGLMGMAPFVDDEGIVRAAFRKLAEIFHQSKSLEGPGYQARELSMGMSGDFEWAIEEGATMVRVGTALFAADEGVT